MKLKGLLSKGTVKYSLLLVILVLFLASVSLYAETGESRDIDTNGMITGVTKTPHVPDVINFQEIMDDVEEETPPSQPPEEPSGTPPTPVFIMSTPPQSSGSASGGGSVECVPPPETHTVCNYDSETCDVVQGEGTDECINDADCISECEMPYLEVGKDTSPTELTCEPTTIHLGVVGLGEECPQNYPVDVVLVFDRSGSMDDDGWDTNISDWQPIGDAKEAAKTFTDLLGTTDRAGLVSFATTARLDEPLTFNKNLVKDEINLMLAGGFTNMSNGLELANDELIVNGRDNVPWIEILLSDGNNNCGLAEIPQDCHGKVMTRAQEAADAGIIIYTIALGDYANQTLMQEVAAITGGNYYFAPNSTDLEDIYEEIAEDVTTIAGTNIVMYDYLPEYVELNESTLPYECVYNETLKEIMCEVGTLNINEMSLYSFEVHVNQLGTNLTNVYPDSGVYYTDYNTTEQFMEFPETSVTVHGFEGADEICDDGYDNDCDGYTDWEDPDCRHDICNYQSLTCDNVPQYENGDLCEFDEDCNYCGDGIVNNQEECDGGQQSCFDGFGYAGIQYCTNDCVWGECVPQEYCGDGIINDGESCEIPGSEDNTYCEQTNFSECVGPKIGERDNFGYCDLSCGCIEDSFTFSCNVDICGAECNENSDCENYCADNVFYDNGICDLTEGCDCSYDQIVCSDMNYYEGYEYYCDGDTVRKHRMYHYFVCNATEGCDENNEWRDDQLVEDCDDYDMDYCFGDELKHDDGYCEAASCNVETTLTEDCYYSETRCEGTEIWSETGFCNISLTACDSHEDFVNDCDNGLWCDGFETCDDSSEPAVCNNGQDVDCGYNDIEEVATCFHQPEDSINYTWDYGAPFTSQCVETGCNTGYCTSDTQELTHDCSIDLCDAECEDNSDCTCPNDGCVGPDWYEYSNTECLGDCTCGTCEPEIYNNDPRCAYCGDGVLNPGEECEDNSDCPESTCSKTYNDYCDGADLIDYNGDGKKNSQTVTDSVENICDGECDCTENTADCSASPETVICSPACMGDCEVEVHAGHDMSPQWGYPYTSTNDIYIIATTNGECDGMTIPVRYWWCDCPYDNDPNMQEAIETTKTEWSSKYDRLCSTDAAYYNGNNPTHPLECGNCEIRTKDFKFPQNEGTKFWTSVGACTGTFQIDLRDYNNCYTRTYAPAIACAGSCEDNPVIEDTHYICSNEQCVEVSGSGVDECSSDGTCVIQEPTHYECIEPWTCAEVPGDGPDMCSVSQDCSDNPDPFVPPEM